MKSDKRKVVLVGCGMVGMSYAYAMLNQNVVDELVLIDVNKLRAEGEAMDLNHGLAFSGSHMRIWAGDYSDCTSADIVVICAGVAQAPGESRRDLLKRNMEVFKSIIDPITESGFNGIFLVATNPVDIMTEITYKLSGFNPRRVIGSGTALDSARLRYLLGSYIQADPRSVHAYVIGEHGDSEFVPWSNAMLSTKPITDLIAESKGKLNIEELDGIGMSLTRITKAILGDENSVLTVSANLRGEYGQNDVFVGVPCVINSAGIQRILEFSLTDEEKAKFAKSCEELRATYKELEEK